MPRQRKRTAHGDGSIYQEKDGSWRAQVYQDGRTIRRRAATREGAQAKLDELNKSREAGVNLRDGGQAVETFAGYWFREVYCQRDIKPNTAKHTLDMLELHILPVIGTRPLNQVIHAELQTLLNDLRRRERPLAPQTVQHVRRVIQALFSKATQMRLIRDDSSIGLEAPKVRRAERDPLEVAHVQAVLQVVAGTRHEAPFWCLAVLGLRIGEVLALRRTDFATDFATVHIKAALDYHTSDMGTPKSDAADRRLPVPPHTAHILAQHWRTVKELPAGSNPLGLLFPTANGTPTAPRNFERVWTGQHAKTKKGPVVYPGVKQKANAPAATTLHDFRRFVATTLEDLGTGQRVIGLILGHAAKDVTELYIKRQLPAPGGAWEALEATLLNVAQGGSETGSQ